MRLNLKPGVEPYDLLGNGSVIIHARPALAEVIEAAKVDDSILALADELKESAEVEGAELTGELLASRSRFAILLSKAVARQVIESWDGIEDPDGSPAPVTPDRVDALMDLAPIYDAFGTVYLARWLVLSAEKNASSPSPTGTSEGATPTAGRARRPAKTAPKG